MLISPIRIFTTVVVAAVVGVSAQNACIRDCYEQAKSPSTCPIDSDLTCVCSNEVFINTVTTCLRANCTAADEQAALELQQAQCGSASSNSNGAAHGQVPFLNSAIALATVALGGAFLL